MTWSTRSSTRSTPLSPTSRLVSDERWAVSASGFGCEEGLPVRGVKKGAAESRRTPRSAPLRRSVHVPLFVIELAESFEDMTDPAIDAFVDETYDEMATKIPAQRKATDDA
jgi:hypothetical protein